MAASKEKLEILGEQIIRIVTTNGLSYVEACGLFETIKYSLLAERHTRPEHEQTEDEQTEE